jgi:hypothetical protein
MTLIDVRRDDLSALDSGDNDATRYLRRSEHRVSERRLLHDGHVQYSRRAAGLGCPAEAGPERSAVALDDLRDRDGSDYLAVVAHHSGPRLWRRHQNVKHEIEMSVLPT